MLESKEEASDYLNIWIQNLNDRNLTNLRRSFVTLYSAQHRASNGPSYPFWRGCQILFNSINTALITINLLYLPVHHRTLRHPSPTGSLLLSTVYQQSIARTNRDWAQIQHDVALHTALPTIPEGLVHDRRIPGPERSGLVRTQHELLNEKWAFICLLCAATESDEPLAFAPPEGDYAKALGAAWWRVMRFTWRRPPLNLKFMAKICGHACGLSGRGGISVDPL